MLYTATQAELAHATTAELISKCGTVRDEWRLLKQNDDSIAVTVRTLKLRKSLFLEFST